MVGSWETLPRQNSTYLLFCTRKYCNSATTNLLCARGRIKTLQKKIRCNNLIMVSTRISPRKKLVPLVSPLSAVRCACVLSVPSSEPSSEVLPREQTLPLRRHTDRSKKKNYHSWTLLTTTMSTTATTTTRRSVWRARRWMLTMMMRRSRM